MYTILINSSDGFDDCWEPFFRLFRKYWKDCNVPIYLITEHKVFHFDGLNITSTRVADGFDRKLSWSECLIFSLNQIRTPQVLYFQEDYFLEKPVNTKLIDEFSEMMISDKTIKYIGLTDSGNRKPFKQWKDDQRLWKVSKRSKYRISTQAALWDRETLLSYLRPEENGWMFEIFGTQRAKRRDDLFLTVNRDLYGGEKQVIYYQLTGIVKGKWLNTMPELFKNEGIQMDFSKRGFYKEKNYFLRKLETFNKLIKNPKFLYKGLLGR